MDKELLSSLRSLVVFTLVLFLSCGIILDANAQTPNSSSVSDLTAKTEESSLDESTAQRNKDFEQIFINKHIQVKEGPAVLPDKVVNAAYANRINREMSDQSADYASKAAQDVAQQELTRIQEEKEAEEAEKAAEEEAQKEAEEEAQKAAEEASKLAAEQAAQEEAERQAQEEAAAQQAAAEEAQRQAQAQAAAEESQESSSNSQTSNSSGSGHLTAYSGVFYGPSGLETYYNLDMSIVISNMRALGYSGDYWVRDDGVKMFGSYVIVAADFCIHPRGSLVETSLGTGIVCDTGSFIYYNPYQLDIAVSW